MGSDNLTKCHLGLQSATHYYPLKSGTPPIIQTVNYFSVRKALIPSDFRTRICHLDLFYMRNLMPVVFEWLKCHFEYWKNGSAMSFGLWFAENRSWGVPFISFSNDFPGLKRILFSVPSRLSKYVTLPHWMARVSCFSHLGQFLVKVYHRNTRLCTRQRW